VDETLARSLSAEEHAFGVDDGSLHRIPFPIPFSVRVTSAARYRVILAKHRRTGLQLRDFFEEAGHKPAASGKEC
jgi:hypothetical protein